MLKRKTTGEKIYLVFIYILLLIILAVCILPFITLIAKSLSAENYVLSGQITFFPKGLNIRAYQIVFSSKRMWQSFKVSIQVTIIGTILNIMFTIFVAYAVSRRSMPGQRIIMLLYVITMFFNGGLIPTYLVVKSTHLLNTTMSLYVPALVSAFNIVLLRNYFWAIPASLEESAFIDGATSRRILFSIMIPLAMPAIATVSLFSAVGFWNDYFSGLIYITDRAKQPLQIYLRDVIMESDNAMSNMDIMTEVPTESVRGATVLVATVPILLIYPFLQKHFVKGVMVGSVKE